MNSAIGGGYGGKKKSLKRVCVKMQTQSKRLLDIGNDNDLQDLQNDSHLLELCDEH